MLGEPEGFVLGPLSFLSTLLSSPSLFVLNIIHMLATTKHLCPVRSLWIHVIHSLLYISNQIRNRISKSITSNMGLLLFPLVVFLDNGNSIFPVFQVRNLSSILTFLFLKCLDSLILVSFSLKIKPVSSHVSSPLQLAPPSKPVLAECHLIHFSTCRFIFF